MKSRPRGIARLQAGVRSFSTAVTQAKERAAAMPPSSGDVVPDREALRASVEELSTAYEELAVADEELHAQLEELAVVSTRAKLERDRYRELFDLAPDGYFLTSRAGVIHDVNAAGATLLGIEPQFLHGKPLAAHVDVADALVLHGAMERVCRDASVEIEVRIKPRGGPATWRSLRVHSVESDSALLWLARDARERSVDMASPSPAAAAGAPARMPTDQLERALRDKNELLDRERTLRKHLEEEEEAKDRFIDVLAHDLRAPLNAVIGWSELLRREVLDKHARDRALATIERNARAQLRLVEELLDISRVGKDMSQLERAPIDLDQLVERRTDALAPAAHASGVHLRFDCAEPRLVVTGDRRRLERVVTKLVANAVASTHAGGHVVVTVRREGTTARLTVADDGRGIAASELVRMFDPFRHDDGPPSGAEPLGLGLYIARRTIDFHGGTLVAVSDGVGRGAVMHVTLPLLGTPAAAVPVPPAAAPTIDAEAPVSAPPSRVALHGVRVLVVDDEEDARELLTAILRHRGASVTTAGDVESALAAFDASQPEVLVSDVGMPGRSGLDLARTLKARATTRATLIAVSGFASPDEVEVALDAGFDVHVAKPVDPAELVGAIREAVDAKPR